MIRRGFSLIEIILGLVLIAMVLALTVSGLSQDSRRGASSKGLAFVLQGELQMARQRAITAGRPVAVCLPAPLAQSVYWLEGETLPRVRRVSNFAGEFPEQAMFVGLWGGGATLDRPPSPLDVQQWLPNGFRDYAFIFAPDGTVTSNDLPLVDDAYHVVVASGLTASDTGSPPGQATFSPAPPYRTLTAARRPVTLRIDLSGTVSQEEGPAVPEGLGLAGLVPPPGLAGGANQVPVLSTVELFPVPTPGSTAATGTVGPGGYVTLVVTASDPDGDRVNVSWVGAGPKGSGTFASAGPVPGEFQAGSWRSVWEWRPPRDAVVGEIYQLTCTLTDERGASVTATTGAGVPRLEIRRPGWVTFSAIPPGEQWRDIYVMYGDGTREKNVTNTPDENEWDQVFSPDGTKIAFARGYYTGNQDIFLINPDGTGEVQLTNSPEWETSPNFSPSGEQIIYETGWPGELWVMDADGQNKKSLGVAGYGSRFSPDGTQVVYDQEDDPDGDIHLVDWDPVTRTFSNDRILASNGMNFAPRFHPGYPNPPIILFTSDRSGELHTHTIDVSTGVVTQKTSGAPKSEGVFSPDGQQILTRIGNVLDNIEGNGLAVLDDPGGTSPATGYRVLMDHLPNGVEFPDWGP